MQVVAAKCSCQHVDIWHHPSAASKRDRLPVPLMPMRRPPDWTDAESSSSFRREDCRLRRRSVKLFSIIFVREGRFFSASFLARASKSSRRSGIVFMGETILYSPSTPRHIREYVAHRTEPFAARGSIYGFPQTSPEDT